AMPVRLHSAFFIRVFIYAFIHFRVPLHVPIHVPLHISISYFRSPASSASRVRSGVRCGVRYWMPFAPTRPYAMAPCTEAVHVQIDDRRRIQRQHLADDQAADDGHT